MDDTVARLMCSLSRASLSSAHAEKSPVNTGALHLWRHIWEHEKVEPEFISMFIALCPGKLKQYMCNDLMTQITNTCRYYYESTQAIVTSDDHRVKYFL